MWDLVNSTQAATSSDLLWDICFEAEASMPGIPIRSVRGVLQDVVFLTMYRIKVQNVFVEPPQANLKHKIQEF